MENNLILFENAPFTNVRIIILDGEPWFIGKDVCNYFGDRNHNRSLKRIEDMDKRITTVETRGGPQKMTVINESGLYSLLFTMQPQKANRVVTDAYPLEVEERIGKLNAFRYWVTHDVLPSVRKGGRYMTPTESMRREALVAEILDEYRRNKKTEGC